ncbi:hypothetical protein [Campylobacter geochelonis]|uniref:hypothetical protein n=1 Tax=Campylobacter geochelonis TaxID=1780362 RepID=UPI00094DA2A8|nr:hypothetical protein [Campylobacter geochelonis]
MSLCRVPCFKALKDFKSFKKDGTTFLTKFNFVIPQIFILLFSSGAFHCNCVFKNKTAGCLRLFRLPKKSAYSFSHSDIFPPFLFYEMQKRFKFC